MTRVRAPLGVVTENEQPSGRHDSTFSRGQGRTERGRYAISWNGRSAFDDPLVIRYAQRHTHDDYVAGADVTQAATPDKDTITAAVGGQHAVTDHGDHHEQAP